MKNEEQKTQFIRFFKDILIDDIAQVGGKSASLGEMYNTLQGKGIKIPNGFAITSKAYWYFLEASGLKETIEGLLKNFDATDLDCLSSTGKKISQEILSAPIPQALEKD